MELRVLFRRDLAKKRGTIICMAILTFLIVFMSSMTFGMKKGFDNSMDEAIAGCDTPDIYYHYFEDVFEAIDMDAVNKDADTKKTCVTQAVSPVNGISSNGKRWGDTVLFFSQKDRGTDRYRLFAPGEESLTGEIAELKAGEVYLPIGMKSTLKCETGDVVTASFGAEVYTKEDGEISVRVSEKREFVVKGFLEMPENGTAVMGYKEVIVSDEDYKAIYAGAEEGTRIIREYKTSDVENFSLIYKVLEVYKADNCQLSDLEYSKALNSKYHLTDYSWSNCNKTEYVHYTGIYIEIFYGICLGFSAILFVIVLVVMANNISSDIENDYTELGILKAIGFTNKKLTLRISSVYIFAELLGMLLGGIAAIPMGKLIAVKLIPTTGIIGNDYTALLPSLLVCLGVLVISILIICIKTSALKRISPVRAVGGGKEDVFFDNRGHVAIAGKGLFFRVALRSITSEPKRYISLVAIVTVLIFMMVVAAGAGSMLKSEKVLQAMGMENSDVKFYTYSDWPLNKDNLQEILDTVNEISPVTRYFAVNSQYITVNDSNIYSICYIAPDQMEGIYRGRAPIYDNEIVCTEIVLKELGLEIGDQLELSKKDKREKYIITGITQSMNDAGRVVFLSYDGLKKIDENEKVNFVGIRLQDASKTDEVIEKLNEKYKEKIGIAEKSSDMESVGDLFSTASQLAQAIVYILSIVFFCVTIRLLIAKAFLRERKDLGIYKSFGFTTGKLRLIFAIRFTTGALLGIIFGLIAGTFLSGRVLGLVLSTTGISYVPIIFDIYDMLFVSLIGVLTIFIASYISSRRIKKVEVRELISL